MALNSIASRSGEPSSDDDPTQIHQQEATTPSKTDSGRGSSTTVPQSLNSGAGSNSGSPQRKRGRGVFADRYIPARSGINLQAAYSLVKDDASSYRAPRAANSNELEYQQSKWFISIHSKLKPLRLFGKGSSVFVNSYRWDCILFCDSL
jgi:cell division cycle 20-like protein 1 (cofactor of APC complex)